MRATCDLEQSPERVFAFLDDLRNHWRLSRRFVEVERVDRDAEGARVRIRGPLGLSRHAHTRIEETDPPRLLRGHATVGRGTLGRVRWTIEARGTGSRVTLEAEVVQASLLDRAVLALGGRRWLRRGLREAVHRLGEQA
ncbi:MAG TPA: SRPBCC family protein [Gaiellaceae bacterium]|nr:SRPBCC family protein [Gaiellaceae bacterium]